MNLYNFILLLGLFCYSSPHNFVNDYIFEFLFSNAIIIIVSIEEQLKNENGIKGNDVD